MFDGWSDLFRFDLWQEALLETGIDLNDYTTRKRDLNEPLPWDHINTRISKAFLQSEYRNALESVSTPDCRNLECQGCGVCDFEGIQPRTQTEEKYPAVSSPSQPLDKEIDQDIRVNVSYEKRGPAKYFGHLELANIFFRAIRRAKILVKFSKGFHPKPKISYHDALPVGMESTKEIFKMTLTEPMDCDDIAMRLNAQLPEGIRVLKCEVSDSRPLAKEPDTVLYSATLPEGEFDRNLAQKFNDAGKWILFRQAPKDGIKEVNLKDFVDGIEFQSDNEIRIRIRTGVGKRIRPWEVIQSVFLFPDDLARQADIIKIYEKVV